MSIEHRLCQREIKREDSVKTVIGKREKRDADQRMYDFQDRKGQNYEDREYPKL